VAWHAGDDNRQGIVAANPGHQRLSRAPRTRGIAAVPDIIGTAVIALPNDVEVAGTLGYARISVISVDI